MTADHPLSMEIDDTPKFGELVECSICCEKYSLKNHAPKVLPCGHTFCCVCLEKLIIDIILSCPSCKEDHVVSPTGVPGLPTNRVITGMLDLSCDLCRNYGKTRRCSHCTHVICRSCLDKHVDSHDVTTGDDVISDDAHQMETDEGDAHSVTSQLVTLDPSVREIAYNTSPKVIIGRPDLGMGELQYPHGVTVDGRSGDIHVVDWDTKSINVYSKAGKFTSSYSPGQCPRDICYTADGHMAITTDNHKVTFCDMSGCVKDVFGVRGRGLGEFNHPWGITGDSQGLLYICDSWNKRVQVFDKSYGIKRVIGDGELGPLQFPLSVAIHPVSGDVYVADRKTHINIYTNTGEYRGGIGQRDIPGVREFRPRYVSFTFDALLCITDMYNHCVHIFKENKHLHSIGREGTSPGELHCPTGVTSTDCGDIIVGDCNNHRIQVFTRI